MEKRLDELRRDLPGPDAFVSPERLDEALAALRETLAGDVAANLETRLTAVTEAARQAAQEEVRTLGEALSGRIEALSGRIEALEADRIDPDALAEQVRQALAPAMPDAAALEAAVNRAETAADDAMAGLDAKPDRQELDAALATLRTEVLAEMERAVPRAAAAVIREEITALAETLL